MQIPFIDLKSQYHLIEDKIKRRIEEVFSHGRFILGPEIYELEKRLGEFVDSPYVISCSSGTDALYMSLLALGVGPGHVVLTSPFTFIATAEVIAQSGAIPAFVDIDETTFNMDPEKLSLAIEAIQYRDRSIYPYPTILDKTKKVQIRGIIGVDIFGVSSEYEEINKIAREHGLFVIEDAAQSFGGTYRGKRTCSLTEIGCTSFFPAKPLGCYGDGGAIFTYNERLAEILTSIRVHGSGQDKYENIRLGINGRMDTLQAAILLEKLNIFPGELMKRQEVATRYTSLLSEVEEIITPSIPEHITSAWAQYSILVKGENRDVLSNHLKAKGIPTAVYYKIPLHLQRAFSYLGYRQGDMQVAEETANHILSLPMHPYLTEEIQGEIVKELKDFFAKN